MDATQQGRWGAWLGRLLLLAFGGAIGCASFSNPTVHDSIPVNRLPQEVFGKPREEEKTIPLTLLQQPPVKEHIVDAEDVLGIFIEGVLGERGQPMPLISVPTQPGARAIPPAVGYPIPVQENGTLVLPLIEPLLVRGKTLPEVQEDIVKAYTGKQILGNAPGAPPRILVTLVKPRTYHVVVIRQDYGGNFVSGGGQVVNSRRGTGVPLDLEVYENDVLHAMARSGGLPGLDAINTIVIQHSTPTTVPEGTTVANAASTQPQVRIPVRMRLNEPLPFSPADVILKNGDIIFIESRDTEVYYTGGLLPVAELPLPRDYDLDVMEAVTQCHGPLFNGALNFNNLGGQILNTGIGQPSPSLVTVIRKTPHGGQITIRVDLNRAALDPRERVLVQPGDFLILQESLGESFTRYLIQNMRFNLATVLLRKTDAVVSQNVSFP